MTDILKETLYITGSIPTFTVYDDGGTSNPAVIGPWATAAESHDSDDATYLGCTDAGDGVSQNPDSGIYGEPTVDTSRFEGAVSFVRLKFKAKVWKASGAGTVAGTIRPYFAAAARGGQSALTTDWEWYEFDFATDANDAAWDLAGINALGTFGFKLHVTATGAAFLTVVNAAVSEMRVETWGPPSAEQAEDLGDVGGSITATNVTKGGARFGNLFTGVAGGGGSIGPATLATGGAARFTNGIPCRGASMVLVRCTSSGTLNSDGIPSAFDFNVGSSPSRADSFSTLASAGGLAKRGNVGIVCSRSGGNVFMLLPTDQQGIIPYDFCQFTVTPSATEDTAGFNVAAEVFYPADASSSAHLYGQGGATVLET